MEKLPEVDRLRAAVQELSVLNEIAAAVSSARSLDQVIELIIQKCVKHLNVEQGAVMLLDEGKSDRPFKTMLRKADSGTDIVPFHFGLQLSGWMIINQQPLLINDFIKDERFKLAEGNQFSIRSLLSVPLRLKGRMIGVLNVFNKKDEEGFTTEDQRLLAIISTQSAQVIENARLYEEEQALLRIEEELRVAQEIHNNLLPKEIPQIPGYDVAGKSVSAKEVGGDYFDFIFLSDNQLAICLGDVSGKGIPASLLMANLQATLRGQSLFVTSCSECLQRSNKLLFKSTDPQKFVTLFYGVLDWGRNELCYSKAGHDPPLLFQNNKAPVRLNTGGTILGFQENSEYEEEKIAFKPGGTLVIYSDGITEAMNSKEEEFGEKRLVRVVKRNPGAASSGLIEKILKAVDSYTGGVAPMDDITLVVVKRDKS